MSTDKTRKTKVTILGTGTSSGVPTIGCNCKTCTSDDPKDKRLRVSALIQRGDTNIVIDSSADFRQQMLKNNVKSLDAVVYTHHHYDHISGFDDIRAYNFTSQKTMPIYLNKKTFDILSHTFSYAFGKAEQIGGGVPLIDVNIINHEKFEISGIEFEAIPMMHGKLEVYGFRIGDFAYCTDTNFIPEESFEKLKDLKYLVLDALRFDPHPTHFNLEQAMEAAQRIGAEQTYFTHIAHAFKHDEVDSSLPERMNLGYDGLIMEF